MIPSHPPPVGLAMLAVPKVFISYSHDSAAHQGRVLELSDRLRADGVDCHVDQYEVSPPEGWSVWMERRIGDADVVLVVCTARYRQRFDGAAPPGEGRGVRWESMLTRAHLYESDALNDKFVPVVLSPGDGAHIPRPLFDVSHYYPTDAEGY